MSAWRILAAGQFFGVAIGPDDRPPMLKPRRNTPGCIPGSFAKAQCRHVWYVQGTFTNIIVCQPLGAVFCNMT